MEEIDELRAKAIASMSSSGNLNSTLKAKSPKSKEEGELSSGEDAELTTCSTAPPDSTTLDKHFLTVAVNNHAQCMKPVQTLPASSSSMANVQLQTLVTRNYSKHFKTKQVPFKSSNIQSLSWHGKGSDDNLVICFSDDDSKSDSEEFKPEETVSRKDNIVRASKSEVPMASSQIQSEGLQGEPNRTKLVPKKGFVNPASISSVPRVRGANFRHLAVSAEKDSLIPRHSPIIKTSARQEHRHVRDADLAVHRLESLRHEIAVRENALKVQSKSIPQSKKRNVVSYSDKHGPRIMNLETKGAGIRRPVSVTATGLAPSEQVTKRLKLDEHCNSKPSSGGQLQLPIPSTKSALELSRQLMENSNCDRDTMGCHQGDTEKRHHDADKNVPVSSEVLLNDVRESESLVPVRENMCSTVGKVEVSSKHENCRTLVSDISSGHKSDKRGMAVDPSTILDPRSCLAQMARGIEDGAHCESHMSVPRNPSVERERHSNISRQIDASNLFPNEAPCERNIARTQQIVATTGVRIPLGTSNHIFEKHSVQIPESKLGNDEASPQNTGLLNYSSQINISGEASMDLQSLVELEELQDKDLEEAQELRRRCELEERRALKAYRKAQRALLDANERCSLLYRKRELFSAQLRALLMEASSSMWPSSWQSHKGTVSESLKAVPEASFDLLSSMGHQLPAEGQILDQLGYGSNTGCPVDAPLDASCQQNGHDFASSQCWEQDASTSDRRDNSALDGVCTPAHHPNMSTDDDDSFPFDNRSIESKLACDITEGNHGQRTADVNAETERLPSNENAQDYELLEASLRSELVARLGRRTSSKSNEISNAECHVHKGADKNDDKKSSLFDQQMQEGEKTQPMDLEGVERTGRSSSQLAAQLHSLSRGNSLSLSDEAHRYRDPEDNSSFPREACWQTQTTVFSLPSSVLHVVSGHAKFMLPGCYSELSTAEEKDAVLKTLPRKVTECVPDFGESTTCKSMRSARTGEMELYNRDLTIEPFWPFCMFELRGKCNNRECQWQHVRNCTGRNLKHNEHSATSCSDCQVSQSLTVGKSNHAFGSPNGLFRHMLSVPTYHIGSNLIKVDSHLSRSVLARTIWQYWQRGFCASFSLPFSVQRILPPDAPFLQTGDGPIADDYSWNRHSLYYQTLDGTMKQFMQGLPESEQSLEMALDLFDGKVYKPDRKKALSLLSRAIEADPSSAVLWVVYLHIYYGKEKSIGKDDMFFHAVQHNEGSYELWLMYINSRMQLGDRLNAYNYALTRFCHSKNAFDKERRYISACILDIFLQMIDFLCMSGDVEKAIQRIYGLLQNSGDTLLSDIHSCLIVSDRCIFWFCCIYLAIYRKLPEVIVQQFEFEKDLPFGIQWPSTHLTTDRKDRALDLMKLAVDKMALDIDNNPHKKDPAALRSLHFLAISHIRCVAALQGLHHSADLLANYLKLYPTCIELVLISARLQENCTEDVVFRGFNESLSNWPKEIPGTQCLWNQYAEHALADKRIDVAEKLMVRWFQGFCKYKDPHLRNLEGRKDGSCGSFDISTHVNSDGGINSIKKDDIFWFLNLSLYSMLQKNLREAQLAIDKALKLAAPEDYKQCVREHAAFTISNGSDSQKDISFGVVLGLLNGYLGDSRSTPILEPMSRKYYRNIKKPRVRQLINNILGPVSRDFTLMNSVLEVCYGPSLLPEKVDDPKDFVDFVESLMEITPANYKLALSVYRFTTINFSHASISANAIKFWASSLLVNSIFQAVPVAPEHVWLEAANVLRDLENLDISLRFHQQAISVYPYSIKLWQSYLNLSRNTGNVNTIVETARGRGVELSQIAD